jgi:5-methylthioribose kinase
VPEVFLWDEVMAVIAMQFVAPPHVMLRAALVTGRCASRARFACMHA